MLLQCTNIITGLKNLIFYEYLYVNVRINIFLIFILNKTIHLINYSKVVRFHSPLLSNSLLIFFNVTKMPQFTQYLFRPLKIANDIIYTFTICLK